MSTIKKEVFIPHDHELSLEVELPADIPSGEAVVTLTIKPKCKLQKPVNRIAELAGKYKGQVWMADDFDAPLEDFAEYM